MNGANDFFFCFRQNVAVELPKAIGRGKDLPLKAQTYCWCELIFPEKGTSSGERQYIASNKSCF